MPVLRRTRNVFTQRAENDNVPARRRRLAGIATAVMIVVTSFALVLVHSVPAWFELVVRAPGTVRTSESVKQHPTRRLAALARPADAALAARMPMR